MNKTPKIVRRKAAADASKKKVPAEKPKRRTQATQDKPWDACTLAGFGIGTEEYLRRK